MNETALFIIGVFVTAFGVTGAIIYGRLVFERWSEEERALPEATSGSGGTGD